MRNNPAKSEAGVDGKGPVFVFSAHRSGGTLISRILNCHPKLVIWGEHGGWINRLAEIDAIAARQPVPDFSPEEYERYVSGRLTAEFDPWLSPFSRAEFRAFCRNFIRKTFSEHLHPNQRWGFKEIRYHRPLTARFLAELFPWGKFVILRRDLTELVVSNVLAPWTKEALRCRSDVYLGDVVRDCAYALTVVDRGLADIEVALSSRAFGIKYEKYKESIEDMFRFLGLEMSADTKAAVNQTLSIKAGGTPKEDEALIKELSSLASKSLAEARESIEARGVDLARLRSLGTGRFCFVVGDHFLKESGLSSIF